MTQLRYTGQQPTSFMAFPYLGEVEPGEFEARDTDAEVLLLRTDIEAVGAGPVPEPETAAEPEVPAAKPRKASPPKLPEAPQPAVAAPTTTA